MITVSMFEAKTNLSKFVSSVELREEPFVLIVRNGKPVAKIVPYDTQVESRIGIAKGKVPSMPSLEEFNSISVEDEFWGDGEP